MKIKKTNAATPASTEAILESISDGVFSVDSQWRIISFNRAAEQITGIPRAEAIGTPSKSPEELAEEFLAGKLKLGDNSCDH